MITVNRSLVDVASEKVPSIGTPGVKPRPGVEPSAGSNPRPGAEPKETIEKY